MDPNLPQSNSVPSNLTTGRRHRVSISASGSYQSYLSSFGHHHRARTTSEQLSLSSVRLEKDYLRILEDGLAEQRPPVGRLYLLKQFVTGSATFLLDDFRRIRSGHAWRPRTLLTFYCCFSILFLTMRIHTAFQEAFQVAQRRRHHSWRPSPELVRESNSHGRSLASSTYISLSQRLSVAFRYLSPQAHLDAFVLQAHRGSNSDLTACFWIEDTRVEEALVSAAAWPGPVSLVVVTTDTPYSTGYKNLLASLTAKRTFTNISMHLLHVPSIAGGSSNAYLNMARFFARTVRVVLFPDGIPEFASFSKGPTRWLDKLPVDIPHPIILSNMAQKAFSPHPALAPVVLLRDHPVWCTERFYMFGSRVLDWEDCLWRLWLESAGEASLITAPHFLNGSNNATSISVPVFVMKTRLRWSTKYRSEACAFTLKRSQALERLSKTEKRHMQWRKKFCQEVL